MADLEMLVPEYVRINRTYRDIPAEMILIQRIELFLVFSDSGSQVSTSLGKNTSYQSLSDVLL